MPRPHGQVPGAEEGFLPWSHPDTRMSGSGIHCKAKGGVGRKNCSLGSSVSRGADPRRAPRPDPRAGPRPDPRPKISGPLGPEIFGRGSGRGPARGSGRGARRGSAPRLTLLPWLQFFLPTPTFALQCFRLISTIQLLHMWEHWFWEHLF